MLSYSITMPATISTTIMNLASFGVEDKKFTENSCNVVETNTQPQQPQQQQAITTSGGGEARNK